MANDDSLIHESFPRPQNADGSPADGYETMRQVNAGPKEDKGGPPKDAYPNTDDNMFMASGPNEKIIRAKRELRDGLNERYSK